MERLLESVLSINDTRLDRLRAAMASVSMRALQDVSVCTLDYSIDYPPESPPNHKLTSQMQRKSRENGTLAMKDGWVGEKWGGKTEPVMRRMKQQLIGKYSCKVRP